MVTIALELYKNAILTLLLSTTGLTLSSFQGFEYL
nr:MAG TPA: hypothetical protein [Caudoviricetes sp.]DAP50466.1 MAG TPA: hypothetical protein [Caudoviricetes sp.]